MSDRKQFSPTNVSLCCNTVAAKLKNMKKTDFRYIFRAAASLLLALACVVTTGCKSDDDDNGGSTKPEAAQVKVINVDVILPKTVQQQWQNSIDWALTNISRAQTGLKQQVKLNLRYHDEGHREPGATGLQTDHA